jgi:hypothetical protein
MGRHCSGYAWSGAVSWNYRIVDWGRGEVDVREVYYGRDGAVTMWTANPRELTGGTPQDIIEDLRKMLADLGRLPPLDYRELPGTEGGGAQ